MTLALAPPWELHLATGERTHTPSARRLQKARQQGQTWKSPDFSGALLLLIGLVIVKTLLPLLVTTLGHIMDNAFMAFATSGRMVNLAAVFDVSLVTAGTMLLPMMGLIVLAGLAVGFAMSGFNFSTVALAPKWDRINPFAGIARLFTIRTIWELLKGLLKIAVVGAMAASAVWGQISQYANLAAMPLGTALNVGGSLLYQVLFRAVLGYLAVGIVDMVFQYRQHQQSLKMTTEELRDETKQTEGDPQLRGRRRAAQRQMARGGLRKVADATVIVTNPTHIAVALEWKPEVMAAPTVVAKGEDEVALEIRRLAYRHEIPLVENRPLAHQLYAVPIGQGVPAHLYQAVAEVLAYVMRRVPGRRGEGVPW